MEVLVMILALSATTDPPRFVPDPPAMRPGLPAIRPIVGIAKTYEEARTIALATGKTLVVWTGKAICLPCVKANAEEFVMFIANKHSLFPDHTLTVAVPVQGQLLMAGQVDDWPDGHLPTIREVLRMWRTNRQTVRRVGNSTGPWRGP